MSDFGFFSFGPLGQPWFDSTLATAGVPLDYVVMGPGSPGFQRSYPDLAGRTVRLVGMESSGAVGGASIDYSLGYPRLSVSSVPGFTRTFMLVAS